MTVLVRECTAADAPTLALIGAATLLETFPGLVPGDALLAHCAKHHTPAEYVAHFEHPATRAWLAEVPPGASPVGYALMTEPDIPPGLAQPGDLELRRIYLFSKFHGGGAGRRLMEAAVAGAREQGARRLLLGVHPQNHRAIAFYRRNGFVEIGLRVFQVGPSQYEDPVFALTL